MARALRIQYPGAYYHVTCRGNDRAEIYRDDKDRKIFKDKLKLSREVYGVEILAYVMMSNHFHLLLQTPRGNLSEFMRHFNISYTSAYNRRHGRCGHLYQGRYKSFLIDADNYLLSVSRYIHLNPIKIKKYSGHSLKEQWAVLQKYTDSSLPGYLSAEVKDIVNYRTVLDYMDGENLKGRQAYSKFMYEGISKEVESPLKSGRGSGIIGDAGFIEWVKEKVLSGEGNRREQPALTKMNKVLEASWVIERFSEITGHSREELCCRGKRTTQRSQLMEILYRFCDMTQPEIGRYFGGIDYSAVSQARKRLQKRMAEEKKLRDQYRKIEEQIILTSR